MVIKGTLQGYDFLYIGYCCKYFVSAGRTNGRVVWRLLYVVLQNISR